MYYETYRYVLWVHRRSELEALSPVFSKLVPSNSILLTLGHWPIESRTARPNWSKQIEFHLRPWNFIVGCTQCNVSTRNQVLPSSPDSTLKLAQVNSNKTFAGHTLPLKSIWPKINWFLGAIWPTFGSSYARGLLLQIFRRAILLNKNVCLGHANASSLQTKHATIIAVRSAPP
jgi:hypothetical protein